MSHHISNNIVQDTITPSLFTEAIKFTINGSYTYSSGNNTGSAQGTLVEISATPRRFILVRTDTYTNDIVQGDNNATFIPSESGMYLSIISAEFYAGSADLKTAEINLIENMSGSESSRQSARASFVGSSTNLEVGRLDNSMVVILTAGKKYYYKITGTANGGYINPSSASTGFTLIKINGSKTF